jgi:osmoprotectant transport system ATP-binding protein
VDATPRPRPRAAPAAPAGTAPAGTAPADTARAGTAPDTARASAAPIRLDGIRKQFPDGTVAVGRLSLDVRAGELVVLIGPSGCGKSTVLRMINRMIEPTSGRILLDGEDVTRADPVRLRRRIGYVIQNVGLFPHQTVRANVATVPRLLGWPRDRVSRRTDELLEMVGLNSGLFGRRYPHELSGGQRQRVGVARALAADPVVLLMDEPFSAVDPIVRTRLQDEFLRLQAEVRKTIVLVTHDLDEAVRLGDRIAVLSQGANLEQFASPAELLGQPATPFVEEFVGTDRGIRRLAVTPIASRDLLPLTDVAGVDGLPEVDRSASLYAALAAMLTAGTDHVRVTDAGRSVGLLDRQRVLGPELVERSG